MDDPLSTLHKALQPVFDVYLDTMRNGRYTYTEIQELKEAEAQYREEPSKSLFIQLRKALRKSFSYIQNRPINISDIQEAMAHLDKIHGMKPINWERLILTSPHHNSSRFFGAINRTNESDLMVWIAIKSGAAYEDLDNSALTETLVNHLDQLGCNQLNKHLEREPDFLFDLIMESVHNFRSVTNTMLILYITDEQLAEAIVKHIPHFTHQQTESSYEQAALLIERLNESLSNGRSIPALLRNTNAKTILDRSELIQSYQNYQNEHNSTSSNMTITP